MNQSLPAQRPVTTSDALKRRLEIENRLFGDQRPMPEVGSPCWVYFDSTIGYRLCYVVEVNHQEQTFHAKRRNRTYLNIRFAYYKPIC